MSNEIHTEKKEASRYPVLTMARGAEITIGSRVVLAQDVDRSPDFTANKGEAGCVVDIGSEFVAIKMDNHVAGAEPWSNEVMVGRMYEEDLNDVIESEA